ncbi:hypothetical protein FV113G1_22060 [Fusobacterium varium]|nr:hypothetical protein FV113G1_22060 [Fusobacterium varium]
MELKNALEFLNKWESITSAKEITEILDFIGKNVENFWLVHQNGETIGETVFYGANLLDNGEIELYDSKNSTISTIQIKIKELQAYKTEKIEVVRIELDSVTPISSDYSSYSEEYIELPNGKIIRRYYWDEGFYDGENLPSSSKLVSRYLNGNLIIISKFKDYEILSSLCKIEFENLIGKN